MDQRTLSKAERRAWPLTEFKAYLSDGGLSPGTLSAYLAHVRHVLRTAKSATPDQAALVQALQETALERRASLRAAWQWYVDFAGTKGYELLRYGQTAGDDLGVIRDALPKLVELVPFTVNELYFLTMGSIKPQVDGILFYASAYPNSKRGRVPRFLPAKPHENLEAFWAITGWAYPRMPEGIMPDAEAPFLPEEPEGSMPLPKMTIKSILQSGRKRLQSSSGGAAIGGGGVALTVVKDPDADD